IPVYGHSCFDVVLQACLLFEDDQCPDAAFSHVSDGFHHGLPHLIMFRTRCRTARTEEAPAAELFKRPSKLRLEYHNNSQKTPFQNRIEHLRRRRKIEKITYRPADKDEENPLYQLDGLRTLHYGNQKIKYVPDNQQIDNARNYGCRCDVLKKIICLHIAVPLSIFQIKSKRLSSMSYMPVKTTSPLNMFFSIPMLLSLLLHSLTLPLLSLAQQSTSTIAGEFSCAVIFSNCSKVPSIARFLASRRLNVSLL